MALGDLFRSLEHLAQTAAGVEPLEPGVQFLQVRRVSPAAATALERLTQPLLHRDRTPGGGREVGRVIGGRTRVCLTGREVRAARI